MGLKVIKVHCTLVFTQENFLKNYVEEAARKRASSTCPFERVVEKLSVNCIYSKSLANPKNYKDFRLATCEEQYHDNMRKSTLKRFNDLGHDVYLFEHIKRQVKIKTHNLLGATCTDLSKDHMINC